MEMGRFEEALKDIEKAIEISPENGSYYLLKSDTLVELGRKEEAMKVLDEASRFSVDINEIEERKRKLE